MSGQGYSPMSDSVTHRYIECFNLLRAQNGVRSARQFALSLEIHPQALHKILKGKREVTVEMIRRAVMAFGFNPTYLFTGVGAMFSEDEKSKSSDGLISIPFVSRNDWQVFIGYSHESDVENALSSIVVPVGRIPDEQLIAFELTGNHLRPHLLDGDILICRYLRDKWVDQLCPGLVCAFLISNEVLISRVEEYSLVEDRLVVIDPGYCDGRTVNMPLPDIEEVWYVTTKITTNVPGPHNVQYNSMVNLSSIDQRLERQNAAIESLNTTVERLLKQSRSMRH